MKLALVGLPPREAAALQFFVGKAFPAWTCSVMPAPGPGQALAGADLYMIDLAGVALSRWSEAGEAQLHGWLGAAPALLSVPAFDQSWSALDHAPAGLRGERLAKPHRPEEVRAALERLHRALQRSTPAAEPAAPAAPPITKAPARPVVVKAPAPPRIERANRPSGIPVATATAAAPRTLLGAPPLDIEAFAARVAAVAAPVPLLHRLADSLVVGRPFEVRFTVQNSLIVHPVARWVASNTPLGVIVRVCGSEALSSVVSIRELEQVEAEMRAHRLGMPIAPLPPFLGELAQAVIGPDHAAAAA